MSTEATKSPALPMREYLGRVATGPALGKSLGREEARAAMRMVLDGGAHPVQAGAFLIALRMKRETDDEHLGVLDAVAEVTRNAVAEVDDLVDIGDPYDGFVRGLPAAPFIPAVLAACGLPACSHGVHSMGPKFGLTHRVVLEAAGVECMLDPARAAARVGDPRCGWAYLDQSVYAPALYALRELRTLIVKRPVLTTIEQFVRPLRARGRTHLVTGYVHEPYARVYAMLARAAGFDSALLVRGVEGGVIPSLRQPGTALRVLGADGEQWVQSDPHLLGIEQGHRAPPLPDCAPVALQGEGPAAGAAAAACAAAEAGLAALEGKPGAMFDAVLYGAALCLWHCGRVATLEAAAATAREALCSGKAGAHLRAGLGAADETHAPDP